MTSEQLDEIEARAKAATDGPWRWRCCLGSKDPQLCKLTRDGGLGYLVMDAVRQGMNGAVIRFARRTAVDRGGIMRPAIDFIDESDRLPDFHETNNPDMQFIAHAREDIPLLLAEARRLRDECERLRGEAKG